MAAKSSNDQNKTNQRYFDVANETGKMLLPIEGYQNVDLVPLEEAIEPLIHLVADIRRKAWVAKETCQTPFPDDLSHDESAAIILYTMEWSPHDRCLYVVLNEALRSRNRLQRLPPWFLYLKLFLTALIKLPSERRVIWRGVKMDLSQQYLTESTLVWWGFSSCTTTLEVLKSEQFLGETGTRTLFNIESSNGKLIQPHSYIQSEDEILLLPGTQFKVVGKLQPAPGLHIIHLKEVQPPFTLLEPPSVVPSTIPPSHNTPAATKPQAASLPEVTAVTNDLSSVQITEEKQQKHSNQLFIGGTLLDAIHQLTLNEFYGTKHQAWTLIYKATRHGFSATDFHRQCDEQGPTMTIIQSNEEGYLFGGYTAVPWTSQTHSRKDTTAFLFSLTNPQHHPSTKFNITDQNTDFAVGHHWDAGPIFGTRKPIITSRFYSHDSVTILILCFRVFLLPQ
ncbi:unnamed protein product [Didymodactylos carnosus]|uniref:NAD(P)(+)--arginine ADP-ribosyltransferase n=1 Tax=Didymodactylos carnosus TaxID=1234261 RepID=A0A8S2EWK7_9BILA|nr:unnamed protein product [Didymodactylos carnosus]CAF4128929.1 unnamed protein product [Didymodactylos carnosus]